MTTYRVVNGKQTGQVASLDTAAAHYGIYLDYVYDTETGLYYLQSRYYNPEIGRFINADSVISGIGDEILGNNLFAYCFNNPVSAIDNSGCRPLSICDAFSWIENTIIQPVSQFFNNIKTDIANYNSSNADAGTVFEANYFSCYKGVPVIKTSFDASFSYGIIGISNQQLNEQTLNHEYGHAVMFNSMGIGSYTTDVAIPSLTANILFRKEKLRYDYYGSPWEAEADRLGGVERKQGCTPWSDGAYTSYFDLIAMFFD